MRARANSAAVLVLIALLMAMVVQAQTSGTMRHIGLLSVGTDPARPLPRQWHSFLDGLRALGWVEGQNVAIERRFAGGRSDVVPQFARELVQAGVDVIVATGLRENQAARQATSTIPIVMVVVDDPIGAGFVQSLARPGGNITGLTFTASGIGQKYVELLKAAAPAVTRMAIVASRPQPPELLKEMHDAARALGVGLPAPIIVRGPEEFDSVFARAKSEGLGALIFPSDGLTVLHRKLVVDLALKHRVPAIYTQREHAEAGGLMTYGASFAERFRRAAAFVDKILRGARPADLPVEQPTKFELVLNAKTAKAIGLTFPATLVTRADEVLQ